MYKTAEFPSQPNILDLLKKRSLKEMCAHYDNVRTQVMKIVMYYFFSSFLNVLSI